MKKLTSFALLFVILIGVIFVTVIFNSAYAYMSYHIPGWMKVIAGWYATDQISDSEFTQAIQYMVNQGIIKVQSNDTTVTNSTVVGIIINHLEVQNMTEEGRIALNNTLQTAPANQTSSASNPSQSTPNSSGNPASRDPKMITEEWLHGNMTDTQFIAQIQALINNGQIAPYTEPSTFVISVTGIPTNERAWAESALKSRGVDTSGHPTGGVDAMFLIGFLQYLCNEGYASGDCFMTPGPIHIQNTTIIDALNNNATINAAKTTLQQWLDNKTSDQDLVNQFVALLNNGTIIHPAQDFKEMQTPTQPISDYVKADWGSWASGQISDEEWRHGALAQLYHLGYLHNP